MSKSIKQDIEQKLKDSKRRLNELTRERRKEIKHIKTLEERKSCDHEFYEDDTHLYGITMVCIKCGYVRH